MTQSFDSYKIWYYTGHGLEAYIRLYQHGGSVGEIKFYANGSTLPTNGVNARGPVLHFHLERLPHVLDLLRHEKPLHVSVEPDHGLASIATLPRSPVGEEAED